MGTFYGAPPPEAPTGGQTTHSGQVSWKWIGESWELFTQAAGIWVAGTLFYFAVSTALGYLLEHIFPNPGYVAPQPPFQPDMKTLLSVAGFGPNSPLTQVGQIVNVVTGLGLTSFQYASLYRMAVKQARGGTLRFGDIFSGGPVFFSMLLYYIFVSIAASFGMCFIGLGAAVVWALSLPGWALIAEKESAGRAVARSVRSMKRDWPSGTLLLITFSLIIVASMLPCGMGLLVTMPMLFLISALAYRDMIGFPIVSDTSRGGYGPSQEGVWPPPPQPAQLDPPPDKIAGASSDDTAPPAV